MIHIALRVSHPEGDKKAEDGSPFFGWNKDFDEWMPLYSARVAPFKKHTTDSYENQTSLAQNNTNTKNAPPVGDTVDDQMDLLVENEHIYAVQRK